MKKQLVIFFILFSVICFYSNAQNLVLNPSFEVKDSCPASFGKINYALGWSSYGGTTDYFNSCDPSCSSPSCWGVPENAFGYQPAYDGNAYGGIITYYLNPLYREYLGVQLTHPLSIGEKYFVSAYVVRADGFPVHGASNNIGFRFFTNSSYSDTNSCPTDNFSHINDSSIIADSVNWTKVSGSFIADSAYQYFAIGNFYDDQHTDTVDIVQPFPFVIHSAYYYIDYVCVSQDSLWQATTGIVLNSKEERKINLYPNPFNDRLTIIVNDNEPSEIIIYSFLSRKILQQKFLNSISFDVELFEKGIYIYEIVNLNGQWVRGKIVKQ